MKKQSLKLLKLNKKSISNLELHGGKPPRSANCPPVRSDNNYTCEPVGPTWLSAAGVVCWPSGLSCNTTN